MLARKQTKSSRWCRRPLCEREFSCSSFLSLPVNLWGLFQSSASAAGFLVYLTSLCQWAAANTHTFGTGESRPQSYSPFLPLLSPPALIICQSQQRGLLYSWRSMDLHICGCRNGQSVWFATSVGFIWYAAQSLISPLKSFIRVKLINSLRYKSLGWKG